MARDPKKEAESILSVVWSRVSPWSPTPVDPVRISKELGIDVFDADLPHDVSGAISKQPGADPTILLNRDDSPVRQRFTCAHELGHYVLHADNPDEYDYVDYRDTRSSTGSEADERFANAFAANLLMPDGEVHHRHRLGESSVEMAFHFRVSQDAMVYRLRNLGLRSG